MATKKSAAKKKSKAEIAAWKPTSPLGEAILAGDVERVGAVLEQLGPKAWPSVRGEAADALEHVEAGEWGELPGERNTYGFITAFSDEQRQAARAAVIVTGTAKQAVAAMHGNDDAFALLERFSPSYLPDLAAELVETRWPNIDLAQRLIAAKRSVRPTSEAYVLGLIRWAEGVRRRHHHDSDGADLYELVLSDRGLVDDGVILRLFEVEGTREVSLGIQDKYGKDDSWTDVLVRLVRDGHLDRDVVIDATLSAIERDWPQFRGGWYLRFLDVLALTSAELDARADRFLGLLHSRIPPTVGVALDVVVGLVDRGAVAAATTLAAVSPVVAARGKGQVKTALKLASRLLKDNADDVDVRDAAHRLALDTFVNEDADLQRAALDLLEQPAGRRSADVDDALRATLELVVPRLRARAAALVGEAAPVASTTSSVPTTTAPKQTTQTPTADDIERVVPVGADDLGDVVEVVARAFESNEDPIAVEHAFAGLVQHAAAIRAAPSTWKALRKRANKIDRSLSDVTAQLLTAIVDDEALVEPRYMHQGVAVLFARAKEALAATRGLLPLATPTRRDGGVDGVDLVARVHAHLAAGVELDSLVHEGQLALLRLTSLELDAPTIAAIRALPTSAFVTALRVAVGVDDIGIEDGAFVTTSPFALAGFRRRHGPYSISAPPTISYIRHHREAFPDYTELDVERPPLRFTPHPQALQLIDRVPERHYHGFFADGDLGTVRHALTCWPAALDATLIDGVVDVAGNVGWVEAAWHHRAIIEALRSPRVAMTSSTALATHIVVLGLCGKEPGRVTIAVDALLAGLDEGRVDVEAVGAVASRMLDEGLVLGKRLASSLKAAADGGHVDDVRRLLERALAGDPARAPRDVSALLSLLVHLRVGTTAPLSSSTRTYLQGLTGGGQVAKEKKALLA